MFDVHEFVDDFLAHEGTRVYDPVKAREYYLRTRELKGRTSSKELKTDAKKEDWQVARAGLREAKKGESKALGEARTAETTALREKATAKRTELREKLKAVMEKLTEARKADLADLTDESKKIAEQVEAKIAALPPIPDGITAKQKAKLQAERTEEIAKIRGDAKEDKAEISEDKKSVSADTKAKKTTERESVKAEREAVGTELKASIDKARETYETLKTEMKAKYEAEYQSEYDQIKNS